MYDFSRRTIYISCLIPYNFCSNVDFKKNIIKTKSGSNMIRRAALWVWQLHKQDI